MMNKIIYDYIDGFEFISSLFFVFVSVSISMTVFFFRASFFSYDFFFSIVVCNVCCCFVFSLLVSFFFSFIIDFSVCRVECNVLKMSNLESYIKVMVYD